MDPNHTGLTSYGARIAAGAFAHDEWVRRHLDDAPFDEAWAARDPHYAEHALDLSATPAQDAEFVALIAEYAARYGVGTPAPPDGAPPG